MVQFIVRRILFFVPTFLVIALLTFGLSKLAPGDPVTTLCGTDGGVVEGAYEDCAREYHLDQPGFFFGIHPYSYPDTLHRIFPNWRRERYRRLLDQHGQWPALQSLDQKIGRLIEKIDRL
ncbi:MAG: hypothetical protein AAGH79_17665, partial [Bacteroidota bacterium]